MAPPTPPDTVTPAQRINFLDLQKIQLNKMTLKREAAASASYSSGSSRTWAQNIDIVQLQKLQLNKENLQKSDWQRLLLFRTRPHLHKRLILSDFQKIQLNKTTQYIEKGCSRTESSSGSSCTCTTVDIADLQKFQLNKDREMTYGTSYSSGHSRTCKLR